MYKNLLIIVPILFSLQSFAEPENYVPKFKIANQTIETKVQLQENLEEDLKHLKTIFNKRNAVANFKSLFEEEETFITSL